VILADRLSKVTGGKIYARDFRARDMKGWPEKMLHGHLLRAVHVDRAFAGLDRELLDRLAPGARVVTAVDLRKEGVHNPSRESSKFGRLLVNPGERAEMYGQPVALLVFEHSRDIIRFIEADRSASIVRYDEPQPGVPLPFLLPRPALGLQQYESYHLLRYPGTGAPPDVDPEARFSFMKKGSHDPTSVGQDLKPEQLAVNRLAREVQQRIERDIQEGDEVSREKWCCLDRTFYTPSADPMFMEPEAGIGWWDEGRNTFHLVMGTQSPAKDVANVQGLWPLGRPEVVLTPCPPGGAFGGRDESSFPLYLALAARYAGGPVRLAYDRAEQFLSGIKRHASVVRNRLAYTPAGELMALQSEICMDGGGQANLTTPVLQLAVLHAAGPYRIPRTALHGVAHVTPSAPAGSMRGFGIPQVTFAIECMVDEIAAELGQCPVELRKSRMLQVGDHDVTGMKLSHDLGNRRLCDQVLAQRLWRNRDRVKKRRDREGIAYGVGFACCMEAYGTSIDAGFGGVELSADGTLSVCSSAVDMGQGAATALACATAAVLGAEAKEVTLGDLALFRCLPFVTKHSTDPAIEAWYTPKPSNSMSASMTAFFHAHVVEEAGRVILERGLLPAAYRRCGQEPPEAPQWRWEAGKLVVAGLPRSFSLPELAAEAHRGGGVVGARAHAVFQDHFASARFPGVDAGGRRRPIDLLAVKCGSGEYQGVTREKPDFPKGQPHTPKRTLYASVGHLLAVEVFLRSGRIQVVEAVTVLDAGAVLHRALLEGQAQGGLAMGLGMALTEELSPAPPETAEVWNLNRYLVPRASHMPPKRRMRLVLVDPGPDDGGPRRKGIAEAAMTTVAPAVANAVAHATGLRLCRVPFTPDRVRAALASR